MTETFSVIVFVLFIVGFGLVVADNVRTRFVNSKLNRDVTQGLVDLMEMRSELEKMSKGTGAQKIEETEGFLKFVSQSRDWAFQYIESVQISIRNFQDVFHPIAKDYYKNKEKPIDQETFGRLVEAYKKLVDELPDEGKNN